MLRKKGTGVKRGRRHQRSGYGDDERGERRRDKWELRNLGLDRSTWDGAHPGPLAGSLMCSYIDTWGRYLWQITPLNVERTRLHAFVAMRSANQELIGCDGCKGRHRDTEGLCSANGDGVSWLLTSEKPFSDQHFILHALKEGRPRYPGVWEVVEEDGNDGRHTTWELQCVRVSD